MGTDRFVPFLQLTFLAVRAKVRPPLADGSLFDRRAAVDAGFAAAAVGFVKLLKIAALAVGIDVI
jgi:hypothetical protein